MKKTLILIAIIGAVVSMSSCKKDYTCECVSTVAGTSTTTTTVLEDQKKADAETACNAGDGTVGEISVECELK